MKKSKWMIGILGLSLAGLLTACNLPNQKSNEAAQVMQEVSKETHSDNKDSIIAWGEVSYTESEEISIDFPATVSAVTVKEGQYVQKGESLITLNTDEYQKNIQKLEKQVALNKVALKDVTQNSSAVAADITQLRRDIAEKSQELSSGTKAELQILQNSLTRINKEIEDAKRDCDRQKALFDAGGVSQKVIDDCEDLIDKKEKAKLEIQNNMTKTKHLLKDEIDGLKTSLEYKEVQYQKMNTSNAVNTDKQSINVSVAEIELSIMKEKLSKPYLSGDNIIAPINNGVVKSVSVINGSVLGKQNMAQKVLELINADTIVIKAEVPEEFVLNIKEGDKAAIIPKADKAKTITGTITQIANVAIEKDGERIVKVEVKPDDTEGILKAGYSVDVEFGKQ